jgi:hypothetical protein
LFSDTSFGALECIYPINHKTKHFLKYKGWIQASSFCKAYMIKTIRLSTLDPLTTLWRKSNMGTFTQFCITYVYGNPTPIIHNVHLITCKGHIVNNGNSGHNNFNHLNIHKLCHYPTYYHINAFGAFRHINEQI